MVTVMPAADWRDPETVSISQAAPDITLVVAPLGSHLVWAIDVVQARHLHRRLSSLLSRAEGGAS